MGNQMTKYLHRISSIYFLLLLFFSLTNADNNKPYVILVSLDGFRWDYLDRGLSPNMDKIVDDGIRALSLRPVFPASTFPNHISIVTGLYPENHGIIQNSFENPFNEEKYSLGNKEAVKNAKWYSGEFIWETAEKQGIITASYFWAGSELTLDYRRPTYFKNYNHDTPYPQRVQGVLDWLQLPMDQRPHFITLYFHETDSKGHRFGPISDEINEAIKLVDKQIGDLSKGLTEIGLKDSVNLVIVSDHGMTEINPERVIKIEKYLEGKKYKLTGGRASMMIEPGEEGIYNILKDKGKNFKVYKREEVPEFHHFSNHPFIYPIVIIADPGYSLIDNRGLERGRQLKTGGSHGYEKDFLDMHGIFIAAGPSFKKGFKTGTVWNIDLYPLLCEILKISHNQLIDGRLERISFVLKEN
jgi:predicted AlkP superfamily pyrophosphatase or phosphodiesterase